MYSGYIEGVTLPFVLEGGYSFIIELNQPLIPSTFKIRTVINGIQGHELTYPEQNNMVAWENDGKTLQFYRSSGTSSSLNFIANGTITVNSLEVYIDGVPMIVDYQ